MTQSYFSNFEFEVINSDHEKVILRFFYLELNYKKSLMYIYNLKNIKNIEYWKKIMKIKQEVSVFIYEV